MNKTEELVARLRDYINDTSDVVLRVEAADLIEAQAREIAELRGAGEPVAWIDERRFNTLTDFDATVYARGGFDCAVPLYLHPAIPEGMVLVPKELSGEINVRLGDKYGYPPYGWKATYKLIIAMIAAVKGEM